MKKTEIKEILRERTHAPHVKHVTTTKDADDGSNEQDKLTSLLDNDMLNHAAIVRKLPGEPWVGNSEATNRSLFRKKLKKMPTDDGDGGEYSFSEETVSDLQKILMNLSSTINHSIGRKGK